MRCRKIALHLLFAFAMLLGLMIAMCTTVLAETVDTYYVDADGKRHDVPNATVLENTGTEWGITQYQHGKTETWYVVNHDVSVDAVTVKNDVHLILCDGAALTVLNGINCEDRIIDSAGNPSIEHNVWLTIYGQEKNSGKLNARIYGRINCITINGGSISYEGGDKCLSSTVAAGKIVINGGTVTAACNNSEAVYSEGPVIINGGKVDFKVTGTDEKACIYTESSFTIDGGTTNVGGTKYGIVTEGNVRIRNGAVNAAGSANGIWVKQGFFAVTRGFVTATGTNDKAIDAPFVIVGGDIAVKAGNTEAEAVIVTDYEEDHSQKWAKIGKAVTRKVTFRVVNGAWNDGRNSNVTVELKGFEDEKLQLEEADIPAAGSKPDSGYEAGRWDTTPAAGKEITGDVTYTYTYAKKEETQTSDGSNNRPADGSDPKSSGSGDPPGNKTNETSGNSSGSKTNETSGNSSGSNGKAVSVGSVHNVSGSIYVVTSANTVSLKKASGKESFTLPASVRINKKSFSVTGIQAKAFKGTRVKTLTVKTKKLTKKSVKGSLKGSKVRKVKVKVGKKISRKYVKKYKQIFTKKNAGKKVSVKR